MKNHIPKKLILGKDWGFENPQDLYKINYFIFKNAVGGHANMPPELQCTLSLNNNMLDLLLNEITDLLKIYKDSRIVISKNKNGEIKIGFIEWKLYDYDLQLMEKLEKIILKYSFSKLSQVTNDEFEVISINEPELYKNGYDYIETKTNLSFTSTSIYFNCNLDIIYESKFIDEIKTVFNSFEFDELKFFKNQIKNDVQFQISLIKYRTMLSKIGKYTFDVCLIDNMLDNICKKLDVKIGRINDNHYTTEEILSYTKNIC